MWRYSWLDGRFIIFDARLAILIVLCVFFPHKAVYILTVVTAAVFWFIDKRGLSTPQALRFVRSWLAGPNRYACPTLKRRRLIDYGGF